MILTDEIKKKLFELAAKAMSNAYPEYSGFNVGAALLSSDGEYFIGCNVENASYGLTVCAERNAIFQAVAHGKRTFSGILIMTRSEDPASPCGACRQVMSEFFDDDTPVLLANPSGIKKEMKFSDFFPYPFRKQNLKK